MKELTVFYSFVPGREEVAEKSAKALANFNPAENAGIDVWGVQEVVAASAGRNYLTYIVPTGLKFALPPGLHLQVAGRSGIGLKNAAEPFAGVIDSSYRGEVFVLFHWHGCYDDNYLRALFPKLNYLDTYPEEVLKSFQKDTRKFTPTEKAIAQLVFLNYGGYDLSSLKFVYTETLPDSQRGEKGFGSSDKK